MRKDAPKPQLHACLVLFYEKQQSMRKYPLLISENKLIDKSRKRARILKEFWLFSYSYMNE